MKPLPALLSRTPASVPRLVPLSQEPAAELGSEAKESFPVIRGVSSDSPSDRLR